MALIECPECHQKVSDKATNCIHCGCPLQKQDLLLKIKTPALPMAIVRVKYVFYDNATSKILAQAYQNEMVILKIEKPTTIRVHIGRGFKDALLEYVPHSNAKYCITQVNTLFGAKLVIQEVDVFDSDNFI